MLAFAWKRRTCLRILQQLTFAFALVRDRGRDRLARRNALDLFFKHRRNTFIFEIKHKIVNTKYWKLKRGNKITFCYMVIGNNRIKPRCLSKVTIIASLVLVMMPRLVLGKPGRYWKLNGVAFKRHRLGNSWKENTLMLRLNHYKTSS